MPDLCRIPHCGTVHRPPTNAWGNQSSESGSPRRLNRGHTPDTHAMATESVWSHTPPCDSAIRTACAALLLSVAVADNRSAGSEQLTAIPAPVTHYACKRYISVCRGIVSTGPQRPQRQLMVTRIRLAHHPSPSLQAAVRGRLPAAHAWCRRFAPASDRGALLIKGLLRASQIRVMSTFAHVDGTCTLA